MRLACDGLSSWFDRGAVIITPSPLLAAVATHQFSAHQLQAGLQSWQRPPIQSADAWLVTRWQEARYGGGEFPTLLSPAQEGLLWQLIIEQEQPHLFDIGATAALARRAAKLLSDWHIPIEEDVWNGFTDAQQFQRWHKLFRRRCRKEGWMTRSDGWRLLPQWIRSERCGRQLTVFAAFDRLTPALDDVRQALGELAPVEKPVPLTNKQPVPVKEFASLEQEIESAARWARGRFEQQASSSIGVFVSDLGSRRAFVERTFQHVFYPSAAGLFRGRNLTAPHELQSADSVFHVEAAPLQDHPLIASALLALELARTRIQATDAGAILRCPFLAGSIAERNVRALAELQLRKGRELDVALEDLESVSRNAPQLQKAWAAVRRVLRLMKREQDFPGWARFFNDVLEAVGWPGDTNLAAEEQEAVEIWKDALSGLASLGLVCGPVSFDAAVSELRRLLQSGGPERGDWSSPVQILDASNAYGLRFDYAVLTGLSEESWPPLVTASPLVPLKLQKLRDVPGASPESVQLEGDRMTKNLLGAAQEILLTYSGRISPVIERYSAREAIDWPQWQGKVPRQSFTPALLDSLDDTNAPPYQPGARPRGGTSLIKLQSLCPFRAFAERRLNATGPEEGCFGLDSLERGSFLHDALKYVWDCLATQERLKKIGESDLRALIEQAVDAAVGNEANGPLREQASAAERLRLRELIQDWLKVERDRKHPFSVVTTEEERTYNVAGLQLRLRIDRIDRLSNGKLVLIDYKSGEPSASHLDRDRPREPQLLIYAAAIGDDVDGIFFAQLKPRDPRLVGYSREAITNDRKSKVQKDWYIFLADRRAKVEELARGFAAGQSAVDPLNGACEYCGTKPLCRVNERLRQDEEVE